MVKPSELLALLFPSYPREFAKPCRFFVKSKKELMNYINKYNGKTRCFCSIYNYCQENKTPVIDKVFLDLDRSVEDARKVHEWLNKHDLSHVILFSGKGFHIYIFTEPTLAKDELRGFQIFLEKELGISIDHQTIGDVARMATIPFTLNTKRMRYCIPLTEDQLYLSEKEISDLAKKQFHEAIIYGQKKLILSPYSSYCSQTVDFFEKIEESNAEIDEDKFLKALPSCIAYHLKKKNPNHRERGIIIMYLVEMGFNENTIKNILKKYLTEEKYIHCVGKGTEFYKGKRCENQLHYILLKYRSGDWFFPSHQTLISSGFCNFLGCKHEIYRRG